MNCAATATKLLRCAGCKEAWFCDNDKRCLREAWRSGHKQECQLRNPLVALEVEVRAAGHLWRRVARRGYTWP